MDCVVCLLTEENKQVSHRANYMQLRSNGKNNNITGKAVTTPTVHYPLSTIPTYNTIQHTPTQQLPLRVTPPSNVIQYMIGRPLPHTPRTWNHPTRWSVVVRGWGIAMMSSVQKVLVTQAMKEDHMIKLQKRMY